MNPDVPMTDWERKWQAFECGCCFRRNCVEHNPDARHARIAELESQLLSAQQEIERLKKTLKTPLFHPKGGYGQFDLP